MRIVFNQVHLRLYRTQTPVCVRIYEIKRTSGLQYKHSSCHPDEGEMNSGTGNQTIETKQLKKKTVPIFNGATYIEIKYHTHTQRHGGRWA